MIVGQQLVAFEVFKKLLKMINGGLINYQYFFPPTSEILFPTLLTSPFFDRLLYWAFIYFIFYNIYLALSFFMLELAPPLFVKLPGFCCEEFRFTATSVFFANLSFSKEGALGMFDRIPPPVSLYIAFLCLSLSSFETYFLSALSDLCELF